ncbi:MAG: sigma-70 family RNA polymerase sigma factor [Planctomycetia bacterium]|nr:sigma-70 family RNA polymerase sigma factor [Planctomycetia bacterium]
MASRDDFEKAALPHIESIFRGAFALCGRQEEAGDLVQATFLKALRSFDSFRPGTNCRAWLMRILRNTWIDELRHKRTVGTVVPIDEIQVAGPVPEQHTPWSNPEDILESFSDAQVIKALKELPPEQRFALFLSDVEGLSSKEVARITGARTATVRSRSHRARMALRARLLAHAKDLGLAGGTE